MSIFEFFRIYGILLDKKILTIDNKINIKSIFIYYDTYTNEIYYDCKIFIEQTSLNFPIYRTMYIIDNSKHIINYKNISSIIIKCDNNINIHASKRLLYEFIYMSNMYGDIKC
jgi:hypothetical protein